MTKLLFLFAASFLCAQTPAGPGPPQPTLDASRQFVRALPADPKASAPILQSTGRAPAEAMLMQVFNQGMSSKASLDDWADLHRALAGLVALYSQAGNPTDTFRASLFAGVQGSTYRQNESDFVRALDAEQQSLALAQQSGLTGNIFLNWDNLGRDLFSLGKTADALVDFLKSRDLIPAAQTYSRNASQVWRDIVQAELAAPNIPAAAQEFDRFEKTAAAAPPGYRAEVLFAKADLAMAREDYIGVPDLVRSAVDAVLDPVEKITVGYEASLELMSCVLDSINRLPYADALALAAKMDRDVPGLPIQVGGFARQGVRARRRLAGDLESILREDSAAVQQAQQSPNARGEIEALRMLAADFAASGSLANQINALEQAASLERSLRPQDGIPAGYPAAFSLASTFINLASAYARVTPFGPAERTKALDLLTEAAAATEQPAAPDRERLKSARGSIELERAEVLRLAGRREDARKILLAAADGSGPGRYDLSAVYLQLARLDRDAAPDAAAPAYDRAIAEFRASRQTIAEATTHVEAARASARKSLYDAAQKHLDAARAALETGALADAKWKLAYISGLVLEGRTQNAPAIDAYREAVQQVEALRSGLAQEERQSFTDSEWIADLYAHLIAALTQTGRTNEAWQYTERAKARAFVESLQGRRFLDAAPVKLQGELAELDKRIIELRLDLAPENDLVLNSSGRSAAAVKNQLAELENRFTLLHAEAGIAGTPANAAVALDPPALAAIQAALKKSDRSGILVEYALLPNGLTAFLIGPDSFQQVTWKLDVEALKDQVRDLRGLLQDPSSGGELNGALKEIAKSVWAPVAAKLPAAAHRIVVSPAAFLNYLPFETLPGTAGQPLIEKYTISYLPSASTLTLLRAAEPLNGDLFLGALGGLQVDGMPGLPGTLAEVDGIRRVYPRAEVVKEQALTHDAALAALQTHRVVHLATHGIYDAHAPLFSALLTSPASGQPARVSLYELTGLQLKANLVVLSACESGAGKLTQGDEISGLTRTILSAGARTVVSSLWAVDDASTAMLMQAFYAGLSKGVPPSQALREAALAVRKKYPHPSYWAPFILTGTF